MKTIILTLLLIPTLTFASIDKDLKYGVTDREVMKLQEILIEKGYNTLKTGYFGTKTLIAVKKYQADNEIPVTGYVGKLTRSSLNKITSIATPVSQPVEQTAMGTVSISTTTATTTTQEIIATPVVKEYSLLMDTPETINPTIKLETPTYVYHKAANGYLAYIPVTIDTDDIKNGGTLIIRGTVVDPDNADRTVGIGTEFNKTTPKPYLMDANLLRGTYTYNVTLKNKVGLEIYTKTDTFNIPKHESEL